MRQECRLVDRLKLPLDPSHKKKHCVDEANAHLKTNLKVAFP